MKKKFILAGALAGSLLFSGNALAADYTVKSGDTLWRISQNTKVPVSQLKSLNNLRNDIIYPGQRLAVDSKSVPASKTTTTTNSTYKVVKGDTLSGIAKKFNASVTKLQSLNPEIKNIHSLRIGQVIRVNGSIQNVTPTKTTSSSTTYTIKSGDYLSAVAKRFNMSLSQLLKLNPQITNPNKIKAGQVIKVGGGLPSTGQSTSPSTGTSNVNTAPTSSWEQKANAIISTGKKYLGAKYVYGASTNRTDAFDCSSFTLRVFKENGISLPRTSAAQSQVGTPVSLSNLRKGDLVFFDTDYNGTINHVSIAIDNKTLLHAASSYGVSISSLNSYWAPRVVKAVRIL